MRKLHRLALIALVPAFFANAAYADQDCIQDKRSTFGKLMNGITNVANTIDPTVWIAKGILMFIPGEHNNNTNLPYCENNDSDLEKLDEQSPEEKS